MTGPVHAHALTYKTQTVAARQIVRTVSETVQFKYAHGRSESHGCPRFLVFNVVSPLIAIAILLDQNALK